MARRGGLLLWCLGSAFPTSSSCRGLDLLSRILCSWMALHGLSRPGKLLLPGSCLLGPASSSCRGLVFLARQVPLAGGLVLNAWSSLGSSWAGLAAGCYNCPCTSWGTKVPPALVHRQEPPGLGHTRCRALLGQALTVHGHAWPWSRCSLTPHPPRLPQAACAHRGVVGAKTPVPSLSGGRCGGAAQ